eukprot:snap_masked-scaffold_3-processed-gene-4.7-mRNA-1 protein AED:1.00 eAED:1.00 QI:0/-1/0/0/-1/1/1/0/563
MTLPQLSTMQKGDNGKNGGIRMLAILLLSCFVFLNTWILSLSFSQPLRNLNMKKDTSQHHLLMNRNISNVSPRSLFVLGMHHSGTSPLTKILVDLGFKCGGKENLLLLPTNPLKFYEHRDVVHLNQQTFKSTIPQKMKRGYPWVGYSFNNKSPISPNFKSIARNIINEINSHGSPWVLKDPRMSLMLPYWLNAVPELKSEGSCLVLYRNPIESSYRFLGYSLGGNALNLREWGSVWEEYTFSSIASCINNELPLIFVSYFQFCTDPVGVLKKMVDDLKAIGYQFEEAVNFEEAASVLGDKWIPLNTKKQTVTSRVVGNVEIESRVLSTQGRSLWNILNQNPGEKLNDLRQLVSAKTRTSWVEQQKSLINQEGYALFVDSLDSHTLRKLKVLGSSILQFDSKRNLILFFEDHIMNELRQEAKLDKRKNLLKILRENQGWQSFSVSKFPSIAEQADALSLVTDVGIGDKYFSKLLVLSPNIVFVSTPDSIFTLNKDQVSESSAFIDLADISPWTVTQAQVLVSSPLEFSFKDIENSSTELKVKQIKDYWLFLDIIAGRTYELKDS